MLEIPKLGKGQLKLFWESCDMTNGFSQISLIGAVVFLFFLIFKTILFICLFLREHLVL
jgi:hypothetical protein